MTQENINNTKLLVVIRCLVYNHEPYLRDCLEGFVMQQTNFPFVAIVHDDASTDGSAAIIREYGEKYPDIIKPIYEAENKYSKHDGSLGRIINAAVDATGAKYVAMCEGDDYWTDPLKLQKQVDFMETNPEYGMICSSAKQYTQKTQSFDGIIGKKGDEIFENMFVGYSDLITPSVLMRKDLYSRCLDELQPLRQLNLLFDTAIWYWFALYSKIYLIEEPLVVYRVLENSACHSTCPMKLLGMQQRYLNLKIAFMTTIKDFSDDKFIWMTKELIKIENDTIRYAQSLGEQKVRSSFAYKIGKYITSIFSKFKK